MSMLGGMAVEMPCERQTWQVEQVGVRRGPDISEWSLLRTQLDVSSAMGHAAGVDMEAVCFGVVSAIHCTGGLETGAERCSACKLAKWGGRHRQGSVPGPSRTVASRWHVSGPHGHVTRG